MKQGWEVESPSLSFLNFPPTEYRLEILLLPEDSSPFHYLPFPSFLMETDAMRSLQSVGNQGLYPIIGGCVQQRGDVNTPEEVLVGTSYS